MKNNIILTGMMGCGKSTVGRILAERLGLELVDTDREIEKRERRSIPDIFSVKGEAYFRNCELETVLELDGRENLVVACGGGLPMREDCIRPLKESGLVFFLRRDPGETYDAIPKEGRPLAQDGRDAFIERFREREPVYRRWADHIVEARSAAKAVNIIFEIYRRECGGA